MAEGSPGAGWGTGEGLPAGPPKPRANTIANAEGGGGHSLGRGTRQTSKRPSLLSPTPGNGDRHRARKSQPGSVALAGSRELFLNLLIRATCKQERKRPSLCRGVMALWSNAGRLADLHLILGRATDRPVCPELSRPQPGLLPPSRHPAPFNDPSSPCSPSTQPTGDSHRHQHPPSLPDETPCKGLENQPAQPRPEQEP